ncbi:serine protease Do [Bosea sp. AK1]|nr:serine protease Do [Bosea sp. AK1]
MVLVTSRGSTLSLHEVPAMTTHTENRKSILKRGALLAGTAILGIGLAAGLADSALMQNHNAIAQPIQLSGAQTALPSFADLVDKVKPAVVSVRVKTQTAAAGDDQSLEDIPPQLRRFFRDQEGARQGRPKPQVGMAQGSGFFVSQDGYVVTNNHVVENAVEVQLVTDAGKTLDAKVVGTDPRTDLALLKVKDAGNYPYVQLADAKARIGDWVLAIGNPFGLGGTVTAGIVSAQGRDIGSGPYDDFIQIDAPINRGNSGGPTFNQNGEVVGVNTAIYSPSGGNVGIAFAIPASTVRQVVDSLKKDGTVARGFIGVQIQPVTSEMADAIGLKDAKGALVAEAQGNGPAAKAGIRRGDTITAVNGEAIKDARELSRKIATFAPGTKTTITLFREGKSRDVTFEVGRQPAA